MELTKNHYIYIKTKNMANKEGLIDLLQRLHEYMDNRADVEDTESDVDNPQGVTSNEEMSLMMEIDDMLYSLGVDGHGSMARASVDPNYKRGGFEMGEDEYKKEEKYDDNLMESIKKIKSEFKRYL